MPWASAMSAKPRRGCWRGITCSIDAFLEGMKADDALEELQHIEGIGGVVAEAIHDFFDEPHNVKALGRLLEWLTVTDMAAPAKSSPVSGKTVVFTGTLEKMTRQEAKARAESAGREGVRLGLGQDRYRGGGAGRGLEAERCAEARCPGAGRRCLAEIDRCLNRPRRPVQPLAEPLHPPAGQIVSRTRA